MVKHLALSQTKIAESKLVNNDYIGGDDLKFARISIDKKLTGHLMNIDYENQLQQKYAKYFEFLKTRNVYNKQDYSWDEPPVPQSSDWWSKSKYSARRNGSPMT